MELKVRGHKICKHGRRQYMCKDCGGGYFCIHRKQKHTCHECRPHLHTTTSRKRTTTSRKRNSGHKKSGSSSQGPVTKVNMTQTLQLSEELSHLRIVAVQFEKDLLNAQRALNVSTHSKTLFAQYLTCLALTRTQLQTNTHAGA